MRTSWSGWVLVVVVAGLVTGCRGGEGEGDADQCGDSICQGPCWGVDCGGVGICDVNEDTGQPFCVCLDGYYSTGADCAPDEDRDADLEPCPSPYGDAEQGPGAYCCIPRSVDYEPVCVLCFVVRVPDEPCPDCSGLNGGWVFPDEYITREDMVETMSRCYPAGEDLGDCNDVFLNPPTTCSH